MYLLNAVCYTCILLNLTGNFVFVHSNEKSILNEGVLTDVRFTFKRLFCKYLLNDKNIYAISPLKRKKNKRQLYDSPDYVFFLNDNHLCM